MNDLTEVLESLLRSFFLLTSNALYFVNRSEPEEPAEDPAVKEHLQWKEMKDLRRTYAELTTNRLFSRYWEYGLKDEARKLVIQELKNRGLQEPESGERCDRYC